MIQYSSSAPIVLLNFMHGLALIRERCRGHMPILENKAAQSDARNVLTSAIANSNS